MKKIHSSLVSVYYEDTDLTGFVYHTNYLKYAERARSNLLREEFPELQQMLNFNKFFCGEPIRCKICQTKEL